MGRARAWWIALLFGLLVLAVVAGSLAQARDLGRETPTPWQRPPIFTATSEPGTATPGWWADIGTPPPWPTEPGNGTEAAP